MFNDDPAIRCPAAHLATAFVEAGPAAAEIARKRYEAEPDAAVRRELVDGLLRLRGHVDVAGGFLKNALPKESDAHCRFGLRRWEILVSGPGAGEETVGDLISILVRLEEENSLVGSAYQEGFQEAAHALGSQREAQALGQALEAACSDELCLGLAARLLRLVFEDHRSGWTQLSYRRLNRDGSEAKGRGFAWILPRMLIQLLVWRVFPKLRRAAMRQPRAIEFWGLKGLAPGIPEKLNAAQRTALRTVVSQPLLWKLRTNLWRLFGLPDSRDALSAFLDARS